MPSAHRQRSSVVAMAAEVGFGAAAASIAVPGHIALEAMLANRREKVLGELHPLSQHIAKIPTQRRRRYPPVGRLAGSNLRKEKSRFCTMTVATPFTLRPLERTAASSTLDQASFRVHLSVKELRNLGLIAGDRIRLTTLRGFHGYAVAWLAQQTNPGNKPVVKVSDVLREKFDLVLTDAIFIEKVADPPKPVHSVQVSFSQTSDALGKYADHDELVLFTKSALGQ